MKYLYKLFLFGFIGMIFMAVFWTIGGLLDLKGKSQLAYLSFLASVMVFAIRFVLNELRDDYYKICIKWFKGDEGFANVYMKMYDFSKPVVLILSILLLTTSIVLLFV